MLEELKTFIAVVEEKNFTKAAEQVNLSQPSVSVHIKNLEAYFGTELITRCTKQKTLLLTDSGKLLYCRSKELLSLLQATEDELRNLSNSPKGHLRIGASHTIGEYLLPHFLGKFCTKYPDIEIEVIIGNTTEVTSMVKAFKVDLALIEGNIHSDSFIQHYFLEDPLVLVAPQHTDLPATISNFSLLQNQRWLAPEHGSGLRETLDFFLTNHHIVPSSRIVFNSNLALLQAVKNNLGIALISTHLLLTQSQIENTFKVITLEDNVHLTFSYILSKELRPSRATYILLDELKTYVENLSNQLHTLALQQ